MGGNEAPRGDDGRAMRIGPYEVLLTLGTGGVGEVYLAKKPGPGQFRRLVAVKRLHPQYATNASVVAMFVDEATLAARIHHANVIPIVDVGKDAEGFYYSVMEYIEGGSVHQLVWYAARAGLTMPRAVAVRIVLDTLEGLHAAHELEGDDGAPLNMVHRDVSPPNILVGTDGVSRLGDFGVARASSLRTADTRGPVLKGKLEYMAPEQIEHDPVDRTTDLFAAGIVFWELVTGRRLFSAPNQLKAIQRICLDPIPSPRSVDPTISPALESAVMRGLERPRARRPQTAAAFAEQIERAVRGREGIATSREVAAFLHAVIGNELLQRRENLREGVHVNVAPPQPEPVRQGPGTLQLPDSMLELARGPRATEVRPTAPQAAAPPAAPYGLDEDTVPIADLFVANPVDAVYSEDVVFDDEEAPVATRDGRPAPGARSSRSR